MTKSLSRRLRPLLRQRLDETPVLLLEGLVDVGKSTVQLWLMVLFIVGNLVSAIAPTYSIMLIGRVVAALCHGAFSPATSPRWARA